MTATDKQKANLKPFVKADPRINRKGVPPDAIAARKFVQQIGAELVKSPDGVEMTRYYAMLRRMYSSNFPKDREMIIKITQPGLLKDEIDVNHSGGIEIVKK